MQGREVCEALLGEVERLGGRSGDAATEGAADGAGGVAKVVVVDACARQPAEGDRAVGRSHAHGGRRPALGGGAV